MKKINYNLKMFSANADRLGQKKAQHHPPNQ